jgi:photosystem II stability/assembly factor-like uncharacterized protein
MNMSDTRWVHVGRLVCVVGLIAGCSAPGEEPAAVGSAGSATFESAGSSPVGMGGGTMQNVEAGSAGSNASSGAAGSPGVAGHGGAAGSPGSAGTALTPGLWKDISPPGVPYGQDGTIALGVAVDPCNPAILYLCITGYNPVTAKGGVYKSTDAGSTWRRIGKVKPNYTGVDQIDNPIHVRVDPADSQHVYVADGVRGSTTGFWISHDGGETFDMPDGFASTKFFDTYDVALDPTDANHVLVAFHSPWYQDHPVYGTSSGILESKDGGTTWIRHEPLTGWGSGSVIHFLYEPSLGIGDSKTWLLGSPGGLWKTKDGGVSWTKASPNGTQHGGGTIYYTQTGVLYSAGASKNLRSTDNGQSWTEIGPSKGFNSILGDGKKLYTAPCFGPAPFLTSPESDGLTWTDYNSQQFTQGPFEMVIDAPNGIIYSGSWASGLWAMKLP